LALDHESRSPASRSGVVKDHFLGAIYSADKSRVVEGLQQIIERSRFEGAQRVLIVRGYKDDSGRQTRSEHLEHVKAVAFRHLHIEEYQVRFRGFDLLDRVRSRRRFDHGADVRVALQQQCKITPC
jgi:hypothetical protein